MKVRELIEYLESMDQELPVFVNNSGIWEELHEAPYETGIWINGPINIVGISLD